MAGRTARQRKFDPLEPEAHTAPCVPAIEEAVRAWRAKGYPGATDTTRELLRHWFETDHRLADGRRFAYYPFQREAIETLIYLWEVEKVRTRTALLERYARGGLVRLPEHDLFARYAVKMATGSGKTKVMSLAITWQYLNAAREGDPDYAKTFLVIAPNVIVFERLRTDFAGGRIFRVDPLVPKHMRIFWDVDCVMRGDGERAAADGMVFVTNVQQLHESPTREADEPEEMVAVLGPRPAGRLDEPPGFAERIAAREGTLLVINDEAHHTHDEKLKWNEVIRGLHDVRPVAAQLDFSATPRFTSGQLFPWTVYDYPLKRAIFEGVVKRPVKGVARIQEAKSDVASIRYQGYLVAGVERWREYREQLDPLGKRPILFIMMGNTREADEVGDWLRKTYPAEFGGDRTLVIHTDRSGEVSKKDLERAREISRRVDEPDQPVSAIVSVLMLREGWDVRNVTVIMGLRPYTAKANILPEQTIGRGLRLMFPGERGYQERVDILGNETFLRFVEDLERIEAMDLETFELGKDRLKIVTIKAEDERAAYDIELPQLSPALMRRRSIAEEIDAIDVMALEAPVLDIPAEADASRFRYEGYDILTDEKVVDAEYSVPDPQTPQEVIGYYAQLIANDLKLPSQFAHLVPKVRAFFEEKAFGRRVDLEQPAVLRAMSRNMAAEAVRRAFRTALKDVLIETVEPELLAPARALSDSDPFPYSRATYAAKKCVFNLVPCENRFEQAFARWLDETEDVAAFAKLPEQFGFSIEYTDGSANLRYYYPDFVARLTDGEHWLIETKGVETPEVTFKDQAARLWCENATALTGTRWRYMKVRQEEFERLRPSGFAELRVWEV